MNEVGAGRVSYLGTVGTTRVSSLQVGEPGLFGLRCCCRLSPCSSSAAHMGAQLPFTQQSPVSNKTLSTPRNLEAFTGKIATVKPKSKLLTLESLEGRATEIFSCKKGPRYGPLTETEKFRDLKPGMTLVVYYSSRKGGGPSKTF